LSRFDLSIEKIFKRQNSFSNYLFIYCKNTLININLLSAAIDFIFREEINKKEEIFSYSLFDYLKR